MITRPEARTAAPRHAQPQERQTRQVALTALALLVLIALAAALRLAALDSHPGGLYEDEAAEGNDALRLLNEPGFHPAFFADDGGREALFGYLVAGVFRTAGASVVALRVTAALLGVLAVAVTPLLLRRFGRTATLAGTTWAAGSLWLIAVSRDGMRNVLVPLVGTLAMAALLAWHDRPSPPSAALAGATCALGLWTYQPLKLLPLLVLAWLLWIRHADKPRWRQLRHTARWAIAAYALVAAPIAAAAITDPATYFGRGAAVSAFHSGDDAASLPMHVLRTLGMFGVTGDPNPRHDAASIALLPPLIALLAALGAWRAWRNRRDGGHALLLIAVPVFLLPPLLATEGSSPHFLRSLGLAPVAAGLVGLGVKEAIERGRNLQGRQGALAAATAATAALALMTATGAHAYFSRTVSERYDAYAYDLVALADAARQPGATVVLDEYRAYVVRFVDRDQLPRIVTPGATLDAPPGTPILARDRDDLRRTVGTAAAERATVVARDPKGAPVVWQVTL